MQYYYIYYKKDIQDLLLFIYAGNIFFGDNILN